ncbi:MAG: flagellar hook-length control protein FliK [Planctomycetota bacterium]|nr:MAG: flagellar hook-length control protein FliK [Planctomycetota bacterium]
MERDSVQLLRPVPAARDAAQAGGAGALLREGRVLAARVREVLADGVVVLQVAGERLAARAAIPLARGELLLLRAELDAGGWLLRLVTPQVAPQDSKLRAALLALLDRDQPIANALGELRAALEHARRDPAQSSAALDALEAALAEHVFEPGADAAELSELVRRSGLWQEARLLALARDPRAAHALQRDLKTRLLAALDELPDGELRDAVVGALDSLEAGQLAHVARRERGEPLHVEIPIAGEGALHSAHLRVERRNEPRERSSERDSRPAAARALLGIEFSRLGPLAIDIAVAGRAVHLRLRAASPEIAARLRDAQPELLDALERTGLAAQVAIGTAAPEELDAALRAPSPGLLADRPLMDVHG